MTTTDSHSFQLDQINLYGGDVKLFRRAGGGVWQLKIWIREEGKYYRKSLRTKDEDLARKLAEDEYVQIKAKRITGGKIFKITFHQVIDEWLEEQLQEAMIDNADPN